MLGQVGLAGCVLAAVELLTAGFNLTQKQGSMLISWQAVNWGHNAEISWKAKHLLGTCIIPGSAGVTQSLNWSTSFHWALFYSFFLSFSLSLSLVCCVDHWGSHEIHKIPFCRLCLDALSSSAPHPAKPREGMFLPGLPATALFCLLASVLPVRPSLVPSCSCLSWFPLYFLPSLPFVQSFLSPPSLLC